MFPRGKQNKKERGKPNMTTTEIVATILSQFPGSSLVRRSKQTFIAVPMGENEDGVMQYSKIAVSALLAKDTKTHVAFDFDAAKAEHEAYAAEQAAKPKTEKKKSGADPAKQEAKQNRKSAALAWMIDNPGEHPSMEVKNALPEVYGDITIMQVGSDLKELWEEGSLTRREEKGKKFYSFTEEKGE